MTSRRLFALLLLVVACRSAGAPPPPSPAPAPMKPPAAMTTDVGDALFSALQRDDVDGAVAAFDETMARALPAARLRQVWGSLVGNLGPLTAWKLRQRQDAGDKVREEYDLTFERGALTGIVAIDPTARTIAGLFFQPPRAAATPTAPAAPPGVRAEDVTVGDAWKLPATLTLPDRAGRHPAVVLVHGSGPHDRDGTVGANRPFRDIAEALSARGVVVLRYDKRTFVHAQRMDPARTTVDAEAIDDAVAALAFVRARAEVNADAVFVLGHSLGALLAPEIAARDRKTAGVVMLAPPGRPLPAIIVQQLRFLGNTPPETLAQIERQAKRILDGTAAPGETLLGVPVAYFQDLARRDAIATARTLGKPMLLIRGARDYQTTDEDLRSWRQGLSGVKDVSIQSLDDLNHLFVPGSGPPGPAEYAVAGRVAPSLIDAVAAFIDGVVRRR